MSGNPWAGLGGTPQRRRFIGSRKVAALSILAGGGMNLPQFCAATGWNYQTCGWLLHDLARAGLVRREGVRGRSVYRVATGVEISREGTP